MKIKSSRRSPSLLAVPILPPFAALLTLLLGLVMWRITKKRLRFLAWPMDQVALRVAAFAGAVAVAFAVFDASYKALNESKSGVNFTPVGGLAKTYPFDQCRNPMYSVLIFVILPCKRRLKCFLPFQPSGPTPHSLNFREKYSQIS